MLTVEETMTLLEHESDIAVSVEVFFESFSWVVAPTVKRGKGSWPPKDKMHADYLEVK